ncbi:hypothetical protein GCM10009854_05690 [Saccharopolyspora halophila]|uniref:Uncharacterized protein n=1 Tax=Saccharopolyspora halophila TaxID=405551 RepID=A0ABP5SNW1_9PSEU
MRADVGADHRMRSRGIIALGVLWALALLCWIALLGVEWYFTGPTRAR